MEKCSDEIILMTTLPGMDAALAMIRSLVEDRLIACGTVFSGGISQYYWKGELCRDEEALALLKTTRNHLVDIETRFAALHPLSLIHI